MARSNRPCAEASSHRAAEPASEWKPPAQSTAEGSPPTPGTGRKPISPAPPEAPCRNLPSSITAAPIPWPSQSRTKVSRPLAAPSRSSATAARLVSFSTRTVAGSRRWSSRTSPRCQAGRPVLSRSSPVAGSISPGAPIPTLCRGTGPAARAALSSRAAARSTAGPVPVSPPMGSASSARVAPSRSVTTTLTLPRRTSSAARWARPATIPYSLALGPRRTAPDSPTTSISPAAPSRSTRSATVGRERPVSVLSWAAVSGPCCWSSPRASRSLMARAVLGDARIPGILPDRRPGSFGPPPKAAQGRSGPFPGTVRGARSRGSSNGYLSGRVPDSLRHASARGSAGPPGRRHPRDFQGRDTTA